MIRRQASQRSFSAVRSPILIALAIALVHTNGHVRAQCANDNILIVDVNLPDGTITPACPGTVQTPLMFNGESVIVNVTAGFSYTFSTCGNTWDTEITLFNGVGTVLAWNDNYGPCGIQSQILWTASFTGPVTLALDEAPCGLFSPDYSNAAVVSISCSPPITNNLCPNATTVSDGISAFSTSGANGTDITNCGTSDNMDVWFVYEATCTGTVTVSTCAMATFNTTLSVWTACPGSPTNGTQMVCNDNAPGCGLTSTISFSAFAGVNYWIRLAGVNGAVGTGQLGIYCDGVPAGEGCFPSVAGGILPGSGSIQVFQNLTPSQLITDVFLGDCLTASNLTYTGSTQAIGRFTNGWRIGIQDGIIMTSGRASLAGNINGFASVNNGQPGLALLTGLAGVQTYDASVFRFTFVPETEQVTFTYVFASEEYPEWVCSSYNDVFGFFVSGPGYAPNTNIATVPGSFHPVSINTVNQGLTCVVNPNPFSMFYVPNGSGTTNVVYDGFTVPLTTCINTTPCESYTITIAVADAGDGIYDSAVFLKAESFTAGVDLEIGAASADAQASSEANCSTDGTFIFTIEHVMPYDVELEYLVEQVGSAIFSPPIPVTVIIPAGQTSVALPVSAVIGSIGTDVTTVSVLLNTALSPGLGCSCTNDTVTATLYFCDPVILSVDWLGFTADLVRDDREVLCQWTTATERNNSHFTIERSADIHTWRDIGTVAGAGSSTIPHHYEFLDRTPLPGISYYRVRQTDLDGVSEQSIVRSVRRSGPDRLTAWPNPSTGTFTLNGLEDGDELSVFDLSGRMVTFSIGSNGELVLHEAAPGSYVAELRRYGGGEPERLRLVVR